MALGGALAENIRRNERLDRGNATVTGSLVVTVSAPIRTVTNADAQIVLTAIGGAGLDPILCTVGNVAGGSGNLANQFTIFLWKATSNANPTLIASTTATPVSWNAMGTL